MIGYSHCCLLHVYTLIAWVVHKRYVLLIICIGGRHKCGCCFIGVCFARCAGDGFLIFYQINIFHREQHGIFARTALCVGQQKFHVIGQIVWLVGHITVANYLLLLQMARQTGTQIAPTLLAMRNCKYKTRSANGEKVHHTDCMWCAKSVGMTASNKITFLSHCKRLHGQYEYISNLNK